MNYFDNYGWYTSTPITGRTTDIAPTNTSETTTDGELRANFSGYEWVDLPYQTPPPPPAPVVVVPTEVTMRQACLALEFAGLLDDVEAIVATLPRIYQIEWQRASTVQRNNPLVEMVRQQQSMTEAQIDDLFTTASTL